MTVYTDKTDVSNAISCYEQGCIRNPKTGKTIMTYWDMRAGRTLALSSFISKDDVIEALNDVESGYFDYIGENKDNVIKFLDNEFLSPYISSLNDYNGRFLEGVYN